MPSPAPAAGTPEREQPPAPQALVTHARRQARAEDPARGRRQHTAAALLEPQAAGPLELARARELQDHLGLSQPSELAIGPIHKPVRYSIGTGGRSPKGTTTMDGEKHDASPGERLTTTSGGRPERPVGRTAWTAPGPGSAQPDEADSGYGKRGGEFLK